MCVQIATLSNISTNSKDASVKRSSSWDSGWFSFTAQHDRTLSVHVCLSIHSPWIWNIHSLQIKDKRPFPQGFLYIFLVGKVLWCQFRTAWICCHCEHKTKSERRQAPLLGKSLDVRNPYVFLLERAGIRFVYFVCTSDFWKIVFQVPVFWILGVKCFYAKLPFTEWNL